MELKWGTSPDPYLPSRELFYEDPEVIVDVEWEPGTLYVTRAYHWPEGHEDPSGIPIQTPEELASILGVPLDRLGDFLGLSGFPQA